jgi:hypothetical protein
MELFIIPPPNLLLVLPSDTSHAVFQHFFVSSIRAAFSAHLTDPS